MSKIFNDLTADVLKIFAAYEKTGTKPWTYKTAAFDLQYQIGSLAKRVMQLDGERFYSPPLTRGGVGGEVDDQIKPLIADELADILAEILFIGTKLNINPSQVWEKMLESDQEKIKERS